MVGDSDDDDPDHEYQAAGTYQVTLTVTDDDGASGSTTKSVTVAENPPPNQSPTATFTEGCTDLTCSFNSAGSGDPDGTITYSWTFGDGGTSSEPNPSHSYASGGTYTVTLEVRDDADATDDATRQVTVSPANQPPTATMTPPTDAGTAVPIPGGPATTLTDDVSPRDVRTVQAAGTTRASTVTTRSVMQASRARSENRHPRGHSDG